MAYKKLLLAIYHMLYATLVRALGFEPRTKCVAPQFNAAFVRKIGLGPITS